MESIRNLLQDYLVAIWRNRWVALLMAWVVCGVGWAGIYFWPNQYESSARVYVDADAVLTPLLRGLAVDDGASSTLDVLQRTLLSRPNLEKVISKTNLELGLRGPADRELLVQQLGSEIKVTPQTKTLFTISWRSPDPKLAYEVVQTLLDIFAERSMGANRADMENAQQFLQKQLRAYEQQLRDAERRRADFRVKYADILPSSDGGASRLETARSQVAALQGQLADATAKRDSIVKELSTTSPTRVVEGDAAAPGGTRPEILEAERNLRLLQMRLTDQHPDVIAAKQQLEVLRATAGASKDPKAAKSTGGRSEPNRVYEELQLRRIDAENQVSSLQRQVDSATKERDRLEQIARAAPGVDAQSKNLDRDYDVLRKSYEELLARRESTNITAAADTQADKVKLSVVDPPQVPRIPVAPNKLLLVSVVLLVGVGAGVGVAFGMSQLDQSFRSVDDLRKIGLPVLGGISLISAPISPRRFASALGFGFAVLLLVAVYGGLLSHTPQFRALV